MTNISYSYAIHFYYFVNRTVSEELYRSAHFDMISPPVQALPKRTVSTVPLLLKLPDHHPCNRSNVIVSSNPKSNSPTTGSRMKTSILVEGGEDPLQLVGPIETRLSRTQGCRPPLAASATHRLNWGGMRLRQLSDNCRTAQEF